MVKVKQRVMEKSMHRQSTMHRPIGFHPSLRDAQRATYLHLVLAVHHTYYCGAFKLLLMSWKSALKHGQKVIGSVVALLSSERS